jgi:hypothetical protein
MLDEDISQAAIEREAQDMEWAIAGRHCLAPALVAVLADAAKTGEIPDAAELDRLINAPQPAPAFPSGRKAFFSEEIPWCTIRRHYGWGIPCREALDLAAPHVAAAGGFIEVGAGTGYWTKVLSARSETNGIAVDDRSWRADAWRSEDAWTEINRMDGTDAVEMIAKLPVLMVWTDPGTIGERIADQMEPGRLLMLAGPLHCTGSTAFTERLDTWFDLVEETIATGATGSNGDRFRIFRKRETPKTSTVFRDQREAMNPARALRKKAAA